MASERTVCNAFFTANAEDFPMPAGPAKTTHTAVSSDKNAAGTTSPKASFSESPAAARSLWRTLACTGRSSAAAACGMISGKMSVKRLRNHKLTSTLLLMVPEAAEAFFPSAEPACGTTSAAAASRKISANSLLNSWNGPATALTVAHACTKRVRKTQSWKDVAGRIPRLFKNAAVATKGSSSTLSCAVIVALFLAFFPHRNKHNSFLIQPKPAIHLLHSSCMSACPSVPETM